MQRCLQLAELGAGHTSPNPMVGAVLVYKDRIIGEGYHRQYGEAHAEVNCINSVHTDDKQFIEESSLYVSLEPCAHYGKTPPCTKLIIENRIPEVVIGCRDSFNEVNGKGIEKLENAGIQITVGVLEKECLWINRRFFTFHKHQRPYVILKWAKDKDGKIAGTDSSRVLISNEFTNRLVHKWRSEESAILVGTHTALNDDPALTTRLWPGKNPVRLVIDKELVLPAHLAIFNDHAETVVFNYRTAGSTKNIHYQQLNPMDDFIRQLLVDLYQRDLLSVMVEGGATLLQSFIDEGTWDEARVITNGQLTIGQGLNAPVLKNNILWREEKINTDTISFFVKEDSRY
jgi:diaminohydroxyphosphoribosylaminopyrimidine deaminase/5-amino-6-(5-phosphoribosylamino)uracil reductase